MQYTVAINPSILTQLIIKNHKQSFSLYRALFVGLIVALFSLFGYLISQVNTMVGESYQLENQQEKIKALTSDNSYLEIEYSKMNHLLSQVETTNLLNLEKTGRVYYINTVSEVASR